MMNVRNVLDYTQQLVVAVAGESPQAADPPGVPAASDKFTQDPTISAKRLCAGSHRDVSFISSWVRFAAVRGE